MTDPERVQFMAMVKTARQYCNLIDGVPASSDWLAPLFQILPQLHAAIAALCDPGGGSCPPETADIDDRFDMYSQLRTQLGERDMYWLEYDHPSDVGLDEEHRTGSLADDLTDIYFELKRGLKLLEAASADEVAHLWQSGFRHHWGQHLVDAERHLYSLKINNQLQ
jgi:hypothetical protein